MHEICERLGKAALRTKAWASMQLCQTLLVKHFGRQRPAECWEMVGMEVYNFMVSEVSTYSTPAPQAGPQAAAPIELDITLPS